MASDGSRADSSFSENSNVEVSELSGPEGLLELNAGIDGQIPAFLYKLWRIAHEKLDRTME